MQLPLSSTAHCTPTGMPALTMSSMRRCSYQMPAASYLAL